MFIKSALVLGAFAATALAQSKVLFFTHVPNPITDGEAAAITFSTNDTQSPVTIILRKGQSNDLQTIETLTDNASGSQYVWTPPTSLPNGVDYALEITQGKGAAQQVNYFGPFVIQGAAPGASITASTTTSGSNSTMTGNTSKPTNGTMTAGHNNSTMTHTTTRNSAKTTKTTATTKTTGGGSPSNAPSSTTGGAGFQGTPSATPTGAAVSDFTTGSSLALALGAVAAILCLS